MNPILALSLFFLVAEAPDWRSGEIHLTVIRDPYTSSDQVTLCRVRADNRGGRRWSGKALAFEVRAVGASPAVTARGRFGLMLEPYGSLETLIALPGRHDRFEVAPLPPRGGSDERDQTVRRKTSRRKPRSGRDS